LKSIETGEWMEGNRLISLEVMMKGFGYSTPMVNNIFEMKHSDTYKAITTL
jgi:hypothetical protein